MINQVSKIILKTEFQTFNSGFLQDMAAVLNRLKRFGITLDEFIEYIEGLKTLAREEIIQREGKTFELKRIWKKRAKKCPICGDSMMLMPVNNHPKTQVGGEYKSMWYCLKEMDCGYSEFNKESMGNIIKRRNLNGVS